MPNAVVEVVDPIALGAKIVDVKEKDCCCCCDDDFDLASVPESVCRQRPEPGRQSPEILRIPGHGQARCLHPSAAAGAAVL